MLKGSDSLDREETDGLEGMKRQESKEKKRARPARPRGDELTPPGRAGG